MSSGDNPPLPSWPFGKEGAPDRSRNSQHTEDALPPGRWLVRGDHRTTALAYYRRSVPNPDRMLEAVRLILAADVPLAECNGKGGKSSLGVTKSKAGKEVA